MGFIKEKSSSTELYGFGSFDLLNADLLLCFIT